MAKQSWEYLMADKFDTNDQQIDEKDGYGEF